MHPHADVVFSVALHQVLKALAINLDTDDLRPSQPTVVLNEDGFETGETFRPFKHVVSQP